MNGLGEKIYELRKSKHLSQEEFGEELNVSRQAISQWETEAITPRADKINLMCQKFGVGWDYFFPQEEKQDGTPPQKDIEISADLNKPTEEKKTDKTAKILIIVFAAAAALSSVVAVILAAAIPSGNGGITSAVTFNFSSPAVVALLIFCALSILILAAAIIIKHIKK